MSRAVLMVLDSLGIGEHHDAYNYGDSGTNTLKSISEGGIRIPNLKKLGIGNIDGVNFLDKEENPLASFGKMQEESVGKDTTTGHWEIAGLLIDKPFSTFPNGFPQEIINEFEQKTGVGTLVNLPYSGTEILKDYGDEHVRTGKVIVYTSADSVFQIAAHEDVVPLEKLYEMCKIARNMDIPVARVIARPFIGSNGKYERTPNRHDYSVKPFGRTILDIAKESGLEVVSVGKISDIFDGEGITKSYPTKSNMDGVDKTISLLKTDFEGILFTNLVDFDAKFGHRRDVIGYKKALEEFDERIHEILENLREDDVLLIMADHGNDPKHIGTDHTREYVPIIVYGKNLKSGVNLGTLSTFSDVAASVANLLNISSTGRGTEFISKLR